MDKFFQKNRERWSLWIAVRKPNPSCHRSMTRHYPPPLSITLFAALFITLSITLYLAQPFQSIIGQPLAYQPLLPVAGCTDAVMNGSFESKTSGNWTFGTTAATGTTVASPVHSGAGALRLGIPAGTNHVRAESTAYQSITIPATGTSATLTYWERPGTTGDDNDFRELVLLRPNYTVLQSLTRQSGSGNDGWHERSFDLSAFIGQTVVLYFNVSNDGNGEALASYLDDISLQVCDATAEPTATPTATNTPPTSPTPTSPTPTSISTPAPARVQVGKVAPTLGVTTITVPVDLIVLTDQVNIAVLSLDIHYNSAIIKATQCTTSQVMTPLLCNVDTPGRVRLAGVAADGIRNQVNLAQLTFTILQNSDSTEPLALTMKVAGDVNGAAVSTDPLDGAITLTCPAKDECIGIKLYLPVVHR